MLFLKHGVHVVANGSETDRPTDDLGAVSARSVSLATAAAVDNDETTPFDYIFDQIVDDPGAHLPASDTNATVSALKLLGSAMVDQAPPTDANSTIPPVYTYWGQFIDHDMTANTDRDSSVSDIRPDDLKPLAPAHVTANLRNLRRPALDLDSVYGEGPEILFGPTEDGMLYDGIKFRLGRCTDAAGIPGDRIPPIADLDRDLPRIGPLLDAGVVTEDDFTPEHRAQANFRTLAVVGDTRNDENLVISQFHVAFLRFHNRVVDEIIAEGNLAARFGFGRQRSIRIFNRARRLTRWHYQWLVVHDYLKTVTRAGVADKILLAGPQHYDLRDGEAYMPLEFSVAAYRYGHSMVRGGYDHNRNFGRGAVVAPFASFEQLFEFTGNGHALDTTTTPPSVVFGPFRGAPTLPFNWIIEWDRLTDKGSVFPTRFARKIDTHLVPALLDLVNEANEASIPAPLRSMLKQLAQRNLLRGYLLHMPTGQAAAEAMDVEPLSPDEIRQGASPEMLAALDAGSFVERTPLWFYLLKEAEVRCNGNTLGQLGSRLVCETIIGMLYVDESSFIHQGNWDPADSPLRGDEGDPIVTIRDFLRFAGVAPS